MRTSEEDEEFIWREIPPPLSLKPPEEVERETCERRRGRDLLLAIDHGHNSKHAFDWTLAHFCRMADTLHLVHAVSSMFSSLFLCFFRGNGIGCCLDFVIWVDGFVVDLIRCEK